MIRSVMILSIAGILALPVSAAAQTATLDEIRQKIDQIRSINPSAIQAENDAVNRRMDEVWSFLEKKL